jgi:hypothetical protein
MALARVVTCDTTGCLALNIGRPGDTPDDTRRMAERAGWDVTLPDGPHRCPGCQAGRPVLELGECPRCTGATTWRGDTEHCHHCAWQSPSPPDQP